MTIDFALQCSYFEQQICRSCVLLSQPYSATLERKRDDLKALFPDIAVHDVVPTRQIQGSRIRARLAVFGSESQPQFGFLNEQQQIVAVDQCPLHHPLINQLVPKLTKLIEVCRLSPYSFQNDYGELKFIVVTCSPTHQQLMVQLVLRSREAVDRIKKYWKNNFDAELSSVSVMSVNLQPVRSSMINGTVEIPVSENESLPVRYGQTTVLYGPQCFIQTNYEIAEQLYEKARSIVASQAPQTVLDLFCGTGAFSLTSATPDTSIRGMDVSGPAVACAQSSAALNGLTKASYENPGVYGMATAVRPALLADTSAQTTYDAVICNPPRRGLDQLTRRLVQQLNPPLFLYSSCNPETLQRDLKELTSTFRVEQMYPFDMFPFTRHLETLVWLTRR